MGSYAFGRCMDWSPDGRDLIVADRMSAQDPRASIFLLSVENGRRRAVSPPDSYLAYPTLSPDGKLLAYVAGAGFLAGDIFVVPASGGQPRRLTSDRRFLAGLAWTADGKEIVFSSNRGGLFRLWRISASGGAPEPLNVAAEDAIFPAIASKADRLAYVHAHSDPNIWRVAGPAWKGRRTGTWQIWKIKAAGGSATQVTKEGLLRRGIHRWEISLPVAGGRHDLENAGRGRRPCPDS